MKIQDEIHTELRALRIDLGIIRSEQEVFTIPENYFRAFPEEMTELIRTMNAADKDFSTEIPASNPYFLPEHYFDGVGIEILAKVREAKQIVEEKKYPWEHNRLTPFQVPEGYFAQFATDIQQEIFHSDMGSNREIEALSPLLADLKNSDSYEVPAGYFKSDQLVKRTRSLPAKVVEHPSVRSFKLARWAAAAAVVLIFALGGWQFLGNNPGQPADSQLSFEKNLAGIPDARIKEWLSNNLDEEDINAMELTTADARKITAQASLSSFSEEEIKDFLETEVW